jgi:hypothetical protein
VKTRSDPGERQRDRRSPVSGLALLHVCLRWQERWRLVGVRHCRRVHRGVSDDRADRVGRREHRHGDDRVSDLGLSDAILSVLRVSEVIRRRDQKDEWQREGRQAELPDDSTDPSLQDAVRDQAGEDAQQQRVDSPIRDTPPEKLEPKVRGRLRENPD